MAVETADDRAAMLEDFGTTATYTPDGGAAVEVCGIFDNEHVAIDAGGMVSVSSNAPHILCRSADVSTIAQGDAFTIDGTAYLVTDYKPDGTGFTDVELEKA